MVKDRGSRLAKIRQVEQKQDSILVKFFTSPGGQQALAVLDELFYDRPSYNKHEPNQPYHTFYREGQRDVVGFIHERIKYHTKEREE